MGRLVQAIESTGYEARAEKTAIPIRGMTCASCVEKIETELRASGSRRWLACTSRGGEDRDFYRRTLGFFNLVASPFRNLLFPLAQGLDCLKSQEPCGAGLWEQEQRFRG